MQIVDLAGHTEMRDFVRRLQHGDSTLGWRGDPNCTVSKNPDGSWSIMRLDDDCRWRPLLTSSPGMRLDAQPLRLLAERDQHRARAPFDPVAAVIAKNAKVYSDSDRKFVEVQAEQADAVLSQASNPKLNRQYLRDRKAA